MQDLDLIYKISSVRKFTEKELNKDKYCMIGTIALDTPTNNNVAKPSRKPIEEIFTFFE